MKKIIGCFSLAVVFVASSAAFTQTDDDAWKKWSKKEAEKILKDSPWSQNQTDTDTSEMFFSPTSDPNKPGARPTATDQARLEQGATNQSVKDGFGARFIFLRTADERPFIAENTGEVRFYSKFPNGPKIDRRFKVSEMMYNGALEY